MIYQLYSIRDNLIGFGAPMACDNDAVACRSLEAAFNSPESIFKIRPNEFDLYNLGEFDSEDGKINVNIPRLVCNCSDFVGKEK